MGIFTKQLRHKDSKSVLQMLMVWCLNASYAFGGFRGPTLLTLFNLIPTWINNHMPSKVWGKITFPFPNFNGAGVEVWEWKKQYHPTLYGLCYYLSMLGLKLVHVSICLRVRLLLMSKPQRCFEITDWYLENTDTYYWLINYNSNDDKGCML